MRKRTTILIGCLALGALLKSQPITPIVVVGRSMEPTLSGYQVVLGTRDFSEIKRGDIVVFNHDGQRLIKRVTGLPGDKITTFACGDYFRLAIDPKLFETWVRLNIPKRSTVVAPGQLYVTGDNENLSLDSRTFGTIPASDVEVKILDVENRQGVPASEKMAHRLVLRRTEDGWL